MVRYIRTSYLDLWNVVDGGDVRGCIAVSEGAMCMEGMCEVQWKMNAATVACRHADKWDTLWQVRLDTLAIKILSHFVCTYCEVTLHIK